ncbi:hypothetical protein MHBO_000463 [Bonamia ostreae]|uniref:Glycoside hydrolase family 19 catalytic domain-containing protein n=1 Tax=Bonamia ostreae TaxID=126728 RepID=A0ABV2AFM5_9EUKA
MVSKIILLFLTNILIMVQSDSINQEVDGDLKYDIKTLISEKDWSTLFPVQGIRGCHGAELLSHKNFVAAVEEVWAKGSKFLRSKNMQQNRVELAAFLAQTSHETTGGYDGAKPPRYFWGYCFPTEISHANKYCSEASAATCKANHYDCKCVPGKAYYGRGPIMLSWNYNYGKFSQSYFKDNRLMANPDLLEKKGDIAFIAAIWFWSTPDYSKPSCHDVILGITKPSDVRGRDVGFGLLTDIINGGLECGHGNDKRENDRIGFYNHYLKYFGVSDNRQKSCAHIRPF